MPTAAKLVAAIFFGFLGWFCGDLVVPLLPEGMSTGMLNETLAVIGVIAGNSMSGKRAGEGVRAGFGYGLTSAALIAFWGVFVFAGHRMLKMSLDKRFSGPIDALQNMVEIGLGYAQMIAVPSILFTLVIGGLFGGWVTEWVARRWS